MIRRNSAIRNASAVGSALLLSITFGGAVSAQDENTAKASFVNAEGAASGAATISAVKGGLLLNVEITGLPADKWVAFHVHETGSCDHSTGHESAGGHFNPSKSEHGYSASNGPHAGDMPNQYVAADGTLRAQVLTSSVTLSGESGIRGRALMIHANPDDYKTQPSGAAGNRLACGVIE